MIDVNYETALRLIDEAIATKPEGEGFIYSNQDGDQAGSGAIDCQNWHYTEDDEIVPGCIVGTVLGIAGVPLQLMERADGIDEVADGLLATNTLRLTPKAHALLEWAQYRQDNGSTWGKAKRDAIQHATVLERIHIRRYGMNRFDQFED